MIEPRQAWLERRQSHIGGSDVAAVLGLSRWKSPWDVWMSKKMPVEDSGETAAMIRGRILEPSVANWYAEEHKVRLEHLDPYHLHEGPEPWMAASPDAIVLADKKHGLEVKTSRTLDGWGESGSDQVPVDYQLQCHWYMACTDMDRWDVAAYLIAADEFRWYTLRRDRGVEEKIVGQCRQWWEKYIVGDEKPPMDGSDGASSYLKQTFPEDRAPLRDAVGEEITLARRLDAIKKQISALDGHKSELQNKLVEKIGEAEGIRWSSGHVTYKAQERRTLDSKAIRRDHPDIADEYERVSTTRILRTTLKE